MRTNCDDCGKCCEYMLLRLSGDDHAKWAGYHGVEVIYELGKPFAKLPIQCQHLTDDKRCAVHGTDEQPEMCKKFKCSALDLFGFPIDGVQ